MGWRDYPLSTRRGNMIANDMAAFLAGLIEGDRLIFEEQTGIMELAGSLTRQEAEKEGDREKEEETRPRSFRANLTSCPLSVLRKRTRRKNLTFSEISEISLDKDFDLEYLYYKSLETYSLMRGERQIWAEVFSREIFTPTT